MNRLKGKTCIVTGAALGIGQACRLCIKATACVGAAAAA